MSTSDFHVKQADGKKRATKAGERAAYRAYRKFRTMAPLLSEYASDLVGRKVQVVSGPQSQTDGKVITIMPPFELSKQVEHKDCANGDCEACDQMDRVMSVLHHEVAHIVNETFQEYRYTYSEFLDLQNRLPRVKEKYGEWEASRYLPVTYENQNAMYIGASVYMPLVIVFSAIKDLRVNERTFQSFPRMKELEVKFLKEILDGGIVRPDGTVDKWSDFDTDSQMLILAMATQYGVDCTGKLDEQVLADYRDSGAEAMVWEAVTARSSYESLKVSASVVNILFGKGYFNYLPGEVVDGLIDILKMLFGHGVPTLPNLGKGEGIPAQGSRDPRVSEDGEVEQGDDDEGDKAQDPDNHEWYTVDEYTKSYKEIIEGAKNIDGAPMGVNGVHLYGIKEGPAWGYPTVVAEADPSARNKAVNKARLVFEENARVEHHRNQRGGKLNGRVLGKRAAVGDDRLFAKRITPDTRTYEVLIGLDISGSTRGGALAVITATAQALADVCHRAGIKFEIMAHTGDYVDGNIKNGIMVNMYQIKNLDDPWDSTAKENLSCIKGGGGNFDGHTMQFYRKRLDASKCTDKIMFYFTDGAMPASNGINERHILERELKLCKQRGYHVVGVGIGTDSPKQFGMDTVIVRGPNDIGDVLDRMATNFKRK